MPPGIMDAFPKRAKPAPLDADIPYIKCGVCKLLGAQIYMKTEALVKEAGPKRQPKRRLESSANLGGLEESVETMLLNVCNVEEPTGRWLREYDVRKSGSEVVLKRMPPGKCRRECRTVEKVCSSVLESMSGEDLSEMVLEEVRDEASASAFAEGLCKKVSKACKKKPPAWPEGKPRRNEEFVPMTKEDFDEEESNDDAAKMVGPTGNPIKSYKLSDLDMDQFSGSRKVDPRDELKDEL